MKKELSYRMRANYFSL